MCRRVLIEDLLVATRRTSIMSRSPFRGIRMRQHEDEVFLPPLTKGVAGAKAQIMNGLTHSHCLLAFADI